MRVFILLLVLLVSMSQRAQAQFEEEGGWPGIPLVERASLMNQRSFFIVMGTAAGTYLLTKLVFKEEVQHFMPVRVGYFQGYGNTSIFMENVGLEKRLAPWFGVGVELNSQQWHGKDSLGIDHYSGMGMGINTYYRWHVFGKKKLSPYIEYGAGLFMGFKEFPQGGSNFTFNLTTSLGLEYTLNNRNKMRLSYGHIHQSNNDLFETNPGIDGNGLNFSYVWSLKRRKDRKAVK